METTGFSRWYLAFSTKDIYRTTGLQPDPQNGDSAMKLFTLLTVVFLFLTSNHLAPKDDITKELITSKGKTRVYYLYIPSTLQPNTSTPLVVMLHGSGRTGNSLVEKWKELAQKESFIIAGPD